MLKNKMRIVFLLATMVVSLLLSSCTITYMDVLNVAKTANFSMNDAGTSFFIYKNYIGHWWFVEIIFSGAADAYVNYGMIQETELWAKILEKNALGQIPLTFEQLPIAIQNMYLEILMKTVPIYLDSLFLLAPLEIFDLDFVETEIS